MSPKTERASRARPARRPDTVPRGAAPEGGEEVRLSRLHLRLGMLALALAGLEDLEARGRLDGADRALLAEARWRSGDSEGATVAARAHLDAGGDDPIALCIVAEAVAADGRPAEARTLMDRLGPPDVATLDGLFAGMPRRAFWPSAPPEPGVGSRPVPAAGRAADRSRLGPAGAPDPDVAPAEVAEAKLPTLQRDPVAELALARRELAATPERAFLRLALILRIDPTLAPAVLQIVALRSEPAAALLQGDAQRLLGRHLEAEAAFASAADGLIAATPEPRS